MIEYITITVIIYILSVFGCRLVVKSFEDEFTTPIAYKICLCPGINVLYIIVLFTVIKLYFMACDIKINKIWPFKEKTIGRFWTWFTNGTNKSLK